jgi:hypothetical protein
MKHGVFQTTIVALLSAISAVVTGCAQQAVASGTAGAEELVASLRARSVPGIPDTLAPETAAQIESMRTGPGGWFVQNGCFACHSVSVHGVRALTPTAPDLSTAVASVRARYDMSIDKFIYEPVGTMAFVFSQYTVLSASDKAAGVRKLKEAAAERERQNPAE